MLAEYECEVEGEVLVAGQAQEEGRRALAGWGRLWVLEAGGHTLFSIWGGGSAGGEEAFTWMYSTTLSSPKSRRAV